MLAMDKHQEVSFNDFDVKDLFISLGCLVIKNYSGVILQYDDQLSSEIKSTLTSVVNNLQICDQLKSRIYGLKEGINQIEIKFDNLDESQSEKLKKLKEQKKRFIRSLNLKEKRLTQLNQENINLLLKLGKKFYQQKLMTSKQKFNQVYQKLDFLLSDKGNSVTELDQLLVESWDKKKFELYNLLQPYPKFLVNS